MNLRLVLKKVVPAEIIEEMKAEQAREEALGFCLECTKRENCPLVPVVGALVSMLMPDYEEAQEAISVLMPQSDEVFLLDTEQRCCYIYKVAKSLEDAIKTVGIVTKEWGLGSDFTIQDLREVPLAGPQAQA